MKAKVEYVPSIKPSVVMIIKDGEVRVDETRGRMNHIVRAKTSTSLSFDLTVNDSAIKAIKAEVIIEYKKRVWKRIIMVANQL